jgi:CRP/FNR family cyclic AMP-dependent transcriptional regulator
MRAPYGLNVLDNCMTCPVREQHLFCNLSPSAVQRLNDITSAAVYPRGAMLFIEGQQGRGVFVLCTGKAKLSTTSREGTTIITKISEHGDVLGLNATISNRPYEVTAEMVEPGQATLLRVHAVVCSKSS